MEDMDGYGSIPVPDKPAGHPTLSTFTHQQSYGQPLGLESSWIPIDYDPIDSIKVLFTSPKLVINQIEWPADASGLLRSLELLGLLLGFLQLISLMIAVW